MSKNSNIKCKNIDENNKKCNFKAFYGTKQFEPIYCKKHKEDDMKNVFKICKCFSSRPNFNYEGETEGICCAKCKEDGMIDIKHKKCKCEKPKNPVFGYKNDIQPSRCSKCKEPDMIDLMNKNKKCKCGESQAHFGYPNDKKATCCSKCKENNMIDIHNKKCECGVTASFGYMNENKPICCSSCKKEDMVDVKSKKCKCGNRPTFGYEKDMKRICCKKCKSDDMIDVAHKLCECGIRPNFGYKDDKYPSCCINCKKNDMIDISHNLCKCGIRPNFGYDGDKKPTCCINCKKKDMIDITHNLCKSNMQNILCTQRGNNKYDGYCSRCFGYLYPNNPKTDKIRIKSKELKVVNNITSKYNNFIHDKPLYVDLNGGCCESKRRIDLRKLINGTLLCVEIDENQHRGYDNVDEVRRYNNLFMDFSGKYIFIRYNPDKYKKNNKKYDPTFEKRMDILENEIEKQIKRIENNKNKNLVEIYHLFYDE